MREDKGIYLVTTLVVGELSWYIYIISLKNIHMNMIIFCLVCLAVISIFWSRYWLPSAPPSLGNKISAVRYLTIWFLFLWYNLTTICADFHLKIFQNDANARWNSVLQFKRRHQCIWVCVLSAYLSRWCRIQALREDIMGFFNFKVLILIRVYCKSW